MGEAVDGGPPGRLGRLDAYRCRLNEDLTQVLGLLADGVLEPQIAARFPLSDTAAALALAESRTVAGKVVVLPDARMS